MTSHSVPFFPYNKLYTSEKDYILPVMESVMERGAFIMQQDLEDFEANLAKYAGAKYAFGVADGTNAIMLSLMAAGLQRGDEVIIPTHTFIATAGAIVFAGGVPVVADCGPDHMMDPATIEDKITGKTKAIVPVQLNGRTCDMDAIGQIAEKHGLWIVEDSAQALGSRFKGQCAGTFGKAGTISFFPAKTLGCYGDGGAVLSNDDDVAEKVYMLRDHGRGKDGELQMWGTNSRLDNLQAAILNKKLEKYDEMIARRREIASKYDDALAGIGDLHLPVAPGAEPDHFDIFQNYEIESRQRDDLRQHMADHNVGTIIQWGGKAVHQWEKLGVAGKPPYADAMFDRCFLLPMNHMMTDEDVDYVCDVIQKFFG